MTMGSSNFLFEFPYVWLGVTAENQQTADERIPILLQIRAAKRFVSIEPMLGSVDLAGDDGGQPYFPFDNEEGTVTPGLDWVIAGCESGPGRRPAKIEWFRDLKNQCVDAGVPFFLKQAGGYICGKRVATARYRYPRSYGCSAGLWQRRLGRGKIAGGDGCENHRSRRHTATPRLPGRHRRSSAGSHHTAGPLVGTPPQEPSEFSGFSLSARIP